MQTQRMDFWTEWGKERVGLVENIAFAYIYYLRRNRQLVGSCCITQEAEPGAL